MLPPLALVLMWNVSCTPIREPSVPDKTALKVLVAAPFCMLPFSPNQLAKWPEALASALLSGTNVIVPCAAPVRWNVPLASVVRWKTPVLAVPVTVPGAPVQGFTSWSLKRTSLRRCSVTLTAPALAAPALAADSSVTMAATRTANAPVLILMSLPPIEENPAAQGRNEAPILAARRPPLNTSPRICHLDVCVSMPPPCRLHVSSTCVTPRDPWHQRRATAHAGMVAEHRQLPAGPAGGPGGGGWSARDHGERYQREGGGSEQAVTGDDGHGERPARPGSRTQPVCPPWLRPPRGHGALRCRNRPGDSSDAPAGSSRPPSGSNRHGQPSPLPPDRRSRAVQEIVSVPASTPVSTPQLGGSPRPAAGSSGRESRSDRRCRSRDTPHPANRGGPGENRTGRSVRWLQPPGRHRSGRIVGREDVGKCSGPASNVVR